MKDNATLVYELIKKHFWEMPEDASLTTGKQSLLPEDASDFLDEYATVLAVDMTAFNFNCYFPNEGIRFLPNALLPRYLRTDHHNPEALTVSMLIASANAGRWLFPDTASGYPTQSG
ncbi:Acyl carrier protein [Kosakonia sp. BK9b]